jgi:hypothetical protein
MRINPLAESGNLRRILHAASHHHHHHHYYFAASRTMLTTPFSRATGSLRFSNPNL